VSHHFLALFDIAKFTHHLDRPRNVADWKQAILREIGADTWEIGCHNR
jgi:hypothetical protein